MTLKQCKQEILHALSESYDLPEAESICTLLIEHFTSYSRVEQVLNANESLKEETIRQIQVSLGKLKTNMPLQYVLGETEFYGHRFKVKEGVLIPRPETEELVQLIIDDMGSKENLRILDVGTGSGAIAISISKAIQMADVFATDISDLAIDLATENARALNARVRIIKHDVFSSHENLPGELDCLVSNPPYVMNSEKELMHSNVLGYEPELALFVSDDDPLIYYRRLAEIGRCLLKDNGFIYCEINEQLAKETSECFEDCGFGNIFVYKDINQKNRIIKAGK